MTARAPWLRRRHRLGGHRRPRRGGPRRIAARAKELGAVEHHTIDARDEWLVTLEDEDCHTVIENRLVALTGEPRRAIHLGLSRNDQVLVALRLYLKDALGELAEAAEAVAKELDVLAARDGALAMPGYTHMQRAMPSTVGLWAGAFASELRDDAVGLRAARRRADRNPLGSAAGYGVALLSQARSDHS
jgi:argininosuccinate lyase